MIRSLRTQLLIGVIATQTVALLLFAVVVYSKISGMLYSEFDSVLYEKAQVLSSLVIFDNDDDDDNGLQTPWDKLDFAQFGTSDEPLYLQIWREDGTVLTRSNNLQNRDLTPGEITWKNGTFSTATLPGGFAGRQIGMVFHPVLSPFNDDDLDSCEPKLPLPPLLPEDPNRLAETVTLVVASPTTRVDAVVSRLFWILVVATAFAAVAVPVCLVLIVRRGLRPLNHIDNEIAQVDEQDLSYRIQPDHVPLEIAPVVRRLNGLLQRIETLIQRERSFSSDVSHELRTPLSGISSTIEVCLVQDRSREEYVEALELCHSICCQSQRMVVDLLAISRLEAGTVPFTPQTFNLAPLVDECWQACMDDVTVRHLQREQYDVPATLVFTDKDKLRIVIRNLLKNAVSHCDQKGRVRVRVTTEGTNAVLCVENTGNQVSAEDADRVFDRFWRGDQSRSRTGSHFGLGLFLVRRLTDVMQTPVDVSVDDSWFRVRLTLPARPTSKTQSQASLPELLHET